MVRKSTFGRAAAICAVLAALVVCMPLAASAKVSGLCMDCHTMHNSQDGTPMALVGNVAWDGGTLTGDPDATPNVNLLIADCVGCHSNSGADVIVSLSDGNKVPIVYNRTVPTQYLAGGNFYWVASGLGGDDTKGHNVYGVSGQDVNITVQEGAPGRDGASCESNTSCHFTLAAAPNPNPPLLGNWGRSGCQGCHVFTYHHEDNAVYRFLKGHGGSVALDIEGRKNIALYPDYVSGVEHSDWEYSATKTDHNLYKGTTVSYTNDGTNGLKTQQTVTSFCTGCHWGFHGPTSVGGRYGTGSGSPWLRHPTDYALPTTSEYAGYDPVNDYSLEAPVGWTTIINSTSYSGPVVMCLSCHRPHGSEYPDMLRWDYDTQIASGGGTGGCFTCHTKKDNP